MTIDDRDLLQALVDFVGICWDANIGGLGGDGDDLAGTARRGSTAKDCCKEAKCADLD